VPVPESSAGVVDAEGLKEAAATGIAAESSSSNPGIPGIAASKDTGGSGVVDVEGGRPGAGVVFRLEVEGVWAWARARRGSRALRGSTVIISVQYEEKHSVGNQRRFLKSKSLQNLY